MHSFSCDIGILNRLESIHIIVLEHTISMMQIFTGPNHGGPYVSHYLRKNLQPV